MSENIIKKQARSKQNFIDEIEFKMKKAQERFDAKKLQIKKAQVNARSLYFKIWRHFPNSR